MMQEAPSNPQIHGRLSAAGDLPAAFQPVIHALNFSIYDPIRKKELFCPHGFKY
jgi:hypothetical protein